MFILALLCTIFVSVSSEMRLLRRIRGHPRHRFHLGIDDVTDPAGTIPSLNNLTASVGTWQTENGFNATTSRTYGSISGGNGVDNGGVAVDTIVSQMGELQNQANDGFSNLAGSISSNNMMLDLVRLNLTRLERATKANITRIYGILQDLGDTSSSASTAGTIRTQITDIQTQINDLQTAAKAADIEGDVSTRIADLGSSVEAVESRVTALEQQVSQNLLKLSETTATTTTTPYDATSISALYETWTGRLAMLAFTIGAAALIMSILTMQRLPPKDDQGEEVLLETEAIEEAPVEEEEQYEEEAGEAEEVVEEEQA